MKTKKWMMIPAALLLAGSLTVGSYAHHSTGWCSLDHDHAVHAACTLRHDHALDVSCALQHDHALDVCHTGTYTSIAASHHSGGHHHRHH